MDFSRDGRVRVTLLDLDGWELKERQMSGAELAAGLTNVAGIPEDEAQRIAHETHSQLRSF
jgi:hypothetical protein